MKGFYILAAILLTLGALAYLALKDTDADLRRQHDFLVSSMETIETSLKEVVAPIARLRRVKSTIRIDKELSRHRSSTGTMRAKLNAALHGIETLSKETRGATSDTLARLRKDMDILLLNVNTFSTRVKVIDTFIAERQPILNKINRLLAAVEAAAVAKKGEKELPEDIRHRLVQVTESTRRSLKQAAAALNEIWLDLDRGKICAERSLNDLKNSAPPLETLFNDLNKL